MNQIISVLNKVVLRLKIVTVFCTRGGFINLVSVVSPFLVVLALIRFFVIEGTTVCRTMLLRDWIQIKLIFGKSKYSSYANVNCSLSMVPFFSNQKAGAIPPITNDRQLSNSSLESYNFKGIRMYSSDSCNPVFQKLADKVISSIKNNQKYGKELSDNPLSKKRILKLTNEIKNHKNFEFGQEKIGSDYQIIINNNNFSTPFSNLKLECILKRGEMVLPSNEIYYIEQLNGKIRSIFDQQPVSAFSESKYVAIQFWWSIFGQTGLWPSVPLLESANLDVNSVPNLKLLHGEHRAIDYYVKEVMVPGGDVDVAGLIRGRPYLCDVRAVLCQKSTGKYGEVPVDISYAINIAQTLDEKRATMKRQFTQNYRVATPELREYPALAQPKHLFFVDLGQSAKVGRPIAVFYVVDPQGKVVGGPLESTAYRQLLETGKFIQYVPREELMVPDGQGFVRTKLAEPIYGAKEFQAAIAKADITFFTI